MLAVLAVAIAFVIGFSIARPADVAAQPDNRAIDSDVDFKRGTFTIEGKGFAGQAGKYTRAKVPGGWFVQFGSGSEFFYPDPDHTWDGKSMD